MESVEEKQVENKNQFEKKVWYAGFWARFAAYTIDNIIVTVATYAILIPLGLALEYIPHIYGDIYSEKNVAIIEILGGIIVLIVMFGSSFVYFIFMTHKYQATLGKVVVGISVLGGDGKKLSLGHYFTRNYWKNCFGNYFMHRIFYDWLY